MKNILVVISTIIVLITYQTALAQTTVFNSSLSNNITACLNDATFTVNINNVSPYDFSNTEIRLILPDGISYVPSSVIGGTESGPVDGDTILFELPDIDEVSNTVFSVELTAGCMNNYSAKKNIVEFSYDGDNRIGGTISETLVHESDLYNIKYPNLSLVNMTNQSYSGNIGDTITRCITITNGGNGALSMFELEHDHGSGLDIVSSTMGTVISNTNGTTYQLDGTDFSSIGNNDNLFDPGESITICEKIAIISCSDAQSTYKYRWGCNKEVCQELTDAANITFNSETPHLEITPWDGFSNNANSGLGDNCYGNNVNGDFPSSLTIVNDGSGVAVNTVIDVADNYGGSSAWMSTNYYSSLNISSLTIETNGGGEVPISPTSTYGGLEKPCLPADPKHRFVLNLDSIAPGDTIILRWNHFTCCPQTCDNNKRRSFLRWRFRGGYENKCGIDYDIPRSLSPTSHSYIYAHTVPDIIPSTMMDGETAEVSFFAEEFRFNLPRSNNDQFKYRLILPDGDCLSVDLNSLLISDKDENIVNTPFTTVTSGDTIDFIFNSVVLGSGWNISFDVNVDCNNCSVPGNKEIEFQTLYIPDEDCDCEMLLECSSVNIDVLCPSLCEGANLLETDAKRINLGLPDNNNDGIPDPGPHNMNRVKTNRLMLGDTLEISNTSFIHNPNALDFNSIVLEHDITNHGNRMTYDHSIVEIYRADNSNYYTSSDEDLQFDISTSGGTRSWRLGFDIHALTSLGFPAGVHLKTGDSVLIRSYYVNTSNIGKNIYTLGTTSNMYTTENTNFPTAPNSDLLGCNTLKKQFTLIGYGYANSGENSQSTQNCDEIILSQNYYLSIGPCCNNYAGGNLFPFEYRHWASPGVMQIILPDNYEFVSSRFNFRRTSGTHTGSTSSWFNITPTSINGDTIELDLDPFFGDQASGNPILFGDDGFHGTINVRIRPTCNVENGTKNTKYKWSYRTIDQLDPTGVEETNWRSTDPLTYNGPIFTMQSNILAVNSNSGVDSWDLFFQNTSFSSDVNNFWIGASPSGSITADSVLNLTTNTWYYPNANGIFDVPDLPTDSSVTYRLFTTINSCSPADIDIYSGWGCSGVPDSLDAYECTPLSLNLSIKPLFPAFDSEIEFLGDGSEELCDTLDFQITVRDYQLGFGYNMLTNITLPEYLTLIPNSSVLIFNGDTMDISDPTNTSGNTYKWDLSNDSLLYDGLSGIIDPTKNTYVIYYRAEPLCGFTSGERVFTITSGESFCGSVYESELNYSQPVVLSNMSPPYSTDIKIDIDFITPCGPNNTTTLTIINNGPDDFGVEDSIHFILPDGLTYDPNSFVPIHNATISQTNPTITNSGTQNILVWPLQDGISANDSMTFSVNLLPTPSDISCDNIELRANTSVNLTADCSIDGNTCSAGFITGDTSKLVYTYKTQLDILNTDTDVHLNPDGSETISGQIIVENQGAGLSDSYDIIFDIIQDLNGDGIINAGEPVIWTQTNNTTIPGGGIDTIDFSNVPVSDFCDGILRFSIGENPCFCSEIIVPMDITLSSTPFFDTICSQESTVISYPDLGGFNYNWNPATDLSDPTLPQPEFTQENNSNNPVTYTFVRTIDKSICQQKDTSKIVVNPLPSATINGTIDVCQDDTEPQITFTGTNGTAPYTFTYTIDDGTNTTTETVSTSSGNSVSVDVPTDVVGTFIYELVSVKEGSSITCSNSATGTATIIVNPLPTATITGTVDVCQDDTEPQITFTGNDGTAPYTFTYTIDDGTNSTTETISTTSGNSVNVDVPTDIAGTFTYELESVQDASSNACTNIQSGTATVTINSLPSATIEGTIDVCQDDTEPQITFAGADGTAPYTFTYTIDDGTNSTTETVSTTSGDTITVDVPTDIAGTFTYELESVQDASSTTCSNNVTGNVIITVNPLPTATINGSTEVCQNDTEPQVTFEGNNGTSPYIFTFTIDDGSGPTTETVSTTSGNTVTVDVPTDVTGTYTYDLVSVEDASSTSCSNNATGTEVITVNPVPTATIDGTVDVCQDDVEPQITFTGTDGTAPYTFTYTIDDGTGSTTETITTINGNSITVNAPTDVPGTFTYDLVSVQDASSTTCSDNASGSVIITVNPIPSGTIDGTVDVCQDDTEPQITFTGADGTAPYTFTYTVNDGTGPTTETISTTGGNIVTVDVPTDAPGTFTYDIISVEDASSSTCSNSASGSATITVNPLPTAKIHGSTDVCQEDNEPQITFTGANGTAPYTFTYTVDDGTNTTTETVSTTSGNSVTVNVPTDNPGTYTYDLVSVEDASSTFCSNNATGTATVRVNPLPNASIFAEEKVCQFDTSNIIIEGINSTGDYTFTYNINSEANQTITTNGGSGATILVPTEAPNLFEYELTNVEDPATGCNRNMNQSVTIEIIARPVAIFHPDPEELTSYEWESQMINESIHADHYYWYFGDGSTPSVEDSPIHEFPNEKTSNYTIMLIAYSADDFCVDTTYNIVQFKNELLFYIPNTFTPNGDEYNNTFLPQFTAGYNPNNYTLSIFNRWGEMIFETHDVDTGWDGSYNGKIVQDGTYVWKIRVQKTLTDTYEMFTGSVNLIR